MKLKNRMQNVWWIGVALLLLLGCGLQGTPTPTPVLPTSTPILPTSTLIPPTASPTSTAIINTQAEQARNFVEPILQAVANQKPDFEDDFSSANKGWKHMFGMHGQDGTYAIGDGVARFRLNNANAFMTNDALNQKDFILLLDACLAAGDETSLIQVNFHLLSQDKWMLLNILSKPGAWHIDKMWEDQGRTLVSGSENISPIGEFTRVMIVTRGVQSAIYLNDAPIAYLEDPDFDTSGEIMLFCTSISTTVCEFDNVKFWNLTKVSGLP
jgi:hypothetical protein